MSRKQPVISCVCVGDAGLSIAQEIERLLAPLGGISQFVSTGDRVLLKPNWVAPFLQAVTDWELIAAVAKLVRSVGAVPFLAESAGFEFNTEATFKALGLYDKANSCDLDLINLDYEETVSVRTPSIELEIPRPVLEADTIINLPRLKHHSLTNITAAQKNLFGLLSRATRRKLHATNLDLGIVATNAVIKPKLHILDGRECLTRAVYGKVNHLGVLLASSDPFALDHRGTQLLGHDPDSVGHIRLALQSSPQSASYQTVGDRCDGLEPVRSTAPRQLYRIMFQTAYRLDFLLSHIFPNFSIIPHLHYWLGIRPHIVRSQCTECGECEQVCPVKAIHIDRGAHISTTRCLQLRCLRCVDACPEQAIVVWGLRRPQL